uniref:Uncharacterized protein n=1 Tax=Solanum tuberosum TaxID=4113 RepID=M1DBR1_SOLTU
MVRKPSPFNLLRSLGGGTTGARGGAGVGTESAGVDARRTLVDVGCRRLAELLGESLNRFGELNRARQKDWLKSCGKSATESPFGKSPITFGEQGSVRRKLQRKKGSWAQTKGEREVFRRVTEYPRRPQASRQKLQTQQHIKHEFKGELGTLHESLSGSA